MVEEVSEGEEIRRACHLWKGFLRSRDSNPEIALIFCKGALLSLRDRETSIAGAGH